MAHPRTAPDGPACLAALTGHRPGGVLGASEFDATEFDATELWYTETTAASFTVVRRFPLGAPPRLR
ncbi:hypothetical protein ACWDWO_21160 [Actinopolymorpha singaporensis]|uniref:Uncharacterized protein n=1 Tax=Actinopolymorpha singaporensis TaxID=117157 RepID=A0A1H1QAT8_9ACTN|nr:hypothetical protein [Actinopolymorpha singaporensis]SDS20407.1 hypothetical protein SAMN04489717_1944 [Actinopolymorpha singaporensis]